MEKQSKEIEIPFGSKDSELCSWEYIIPEGMEAIIVDNKIVVKKKVSDDEKIRKELIDYLKERKSCESYGQYIVRYDCWIAWIEKQNSNVDNANKEYLRGYREGKQEILDKYAELEKSQQKPKFKVGDTIQLKNSHIEYIIESIADSHYYGKGFSITIDGGNRVKSK